MHLSEESSLATMYLPEESSLDKKNVSREKGTLPGFLHQFIFFAFGLSGASALIYEVVWTRSLSTIMGSTTYALSTMLAAFMTGLSLGGFAGGCITKKTRNLYTAFALCELGIGLSGFIISPAIKASMPILIKSFFIFHASFEFFFVVQFVLCLSLMIIPTTLMGMTFPLVIKIHEGKDIGTKSGYLYSINTLGAVVGSVSAGFLLIPHIGTRGTALVAASINITIAIVIFILSKKLKRGPSVVIVTGILGMITLHAATTFSFPVSYYMAQSIGAYERLEGVLQSATSRDGTVLYHHEGTDGDVYVLKRPSGEPTLLNHGKLEAGAPFSFELLSYLPFFSLNEKERPTVLNIGLGVGLTLKTMAGLPAGKMDSVELSKGVIEANRQFFSPSLFSDPRITHISNDGRNHLLLSRDRYDIIIASPSWAIEQASAGMLTDEFFSLASTRLAPGGIFGIYLDHYRDYDKTSAEDLEIIFRTFRKNFKHSCAWVSRSDDIILIGSQSPIPPSEMVADRIIRYAPEMQDNFRVVLADEGFEALPEGRINTDSNPVIEWHNAKYIMTGGI